MIKFTIMLYRCILLVLIVSCSASKTDKRKTNVNDINAVSNNMGDSNFLRFWNSFLDAVQTESKSSFSKIALDTLEYEGKPVPSSLFLKNYFSAIFNDSLFNQLSDSSNYRIFDSYVSSSSSLIQQLSNEHDGSKSSIGKTVSIVKKYDLEGPEIVSLEFVYTSLGWKFYGYNSTRRKL